MAYESSVSSPIKGVERLSPSLGIYVGKCDVTKYNSTLVEITGITKYFTNIAHTGAEPVKYPKGVLSVLPTGPSDNGHVFTWDSTKGAFKCWKPTTILMDSAIAGQVVQIDAAGGTATEFHVTNAAGHVYGVATEVANECDAGEIGFIAIGMVR